MPERQILKNILQEGLKYDILTKIIIINKMSYNITNSWIEPKLLDNVYLKLQNLFEADLIYKKKNKKFWTNLLLKWGNFMNVLWKVFETYRKEWSDFIKNWKRDTKWRRYTWRICTVEDKKYFWCDLWKIDIEKLDSLTSDEIDFLLQSILYVWKVWTKYVNNSSVQIWPVVLTKKESIVRNKTLLYNNLLVANIKTHLGDDKALFKKIRENARIQWVNFTSWLIELHREKGIDIPEISEVKKNEYLEIDINKLPFKKI